MNISDNRKARHDFFIEDKFEAGVALLGWEVKSARASTVNLKDSFVHFTVTDGVVEAWLKNAHFSPFQFGDVKTQETRRDRKLLLNKSEIRKIHTAVKAKGYTCVPTRIYFNKQGCVKLEIALALGKKNYDKRAALKERDIERETQKTVGEIRGGV
ncbi:MAG: SsrA-binding protein SmpB [Christensenellaceae bacterium]|jgi:SsrA-binding protein|nr:SsrA-binding protein SmpB [Christensenellaceae bacterium]